MKETDLSRADLNLLVLFEVVYAELHVGRAAKALSLTSSAVSHGLGRLRRWFGDPLFLRTPKGVVPTVRAHELSPAIADILSRVRAVVATVEPFDPARSSRRFRIGAPDGLSAVIVPELLRELGRTAPNIALTVHHLLPQEALTALEEHRDDVAIAPLEEVPARFSAIQIGDEDFVVAARAGHPFLSRPTLENYCKREHQHVIVSTVGGSRGFVDDYLDRRGLSRRVTLSVPHFLLALAAVSESELLAAVPRSLAVKHAAELGLAFVEAPAPVPYSRVLAISTKAALADPGVSWLFSTIGRVAKFSQKAARPRRATRPGVRSRSRAGE